MATLLLIMIYLAFISLGIPDSLLGVAWPVMQSDFGQQLETAGFLYMIIAAGTILSSLASGWLNDRMGTGKVTLISVILTAAALLGFSYAPSLYWLIICAVPLGLGAGAIDAALNNYVALHYKSHHMSWLHCFWGVGASIGPIMISYFIANKGSWRDGYFTIAFLQLGLACLLLLTLPLWSKVSRKKQMEAEAGRSEPLPDERAYGVKPLKIKGVKFALLSFFFYCGVESTLGLWGSSYLVGSKGISAAVAAQWVSFFYGGITLGRLITGFITFKVSNEKLIRSGQITAIIGIALFILPLPVYMSLAGFILAGLGLAPIYPCMIHETPIRFGKKHSQSIIGYQMAVAYTGTTFLPPLLGVLASHTSIGIFPYFALAYMIAMLLGSEKVNRMMKIRHKISIEKEL
ncbi:Glucose/mannose transporter GlcP [Peribacillus sp. Bi96]|uniref:MFS transporter n=1 Tax=Peribacillus sp. Bi96 TaxID=2884273 RepID=UPI001D3AC81D|nr:MFS transporter [Peribacillus sp. Bi96]CAH0261300.1 Glucose/mannose transporter GlcP [Peribacillus sp. Bi96]